MIKAWKKDLGEERRQKIKLEKKLNDIPTSVKNSLVKNTPKQLNRTPRTDLLEVLEETLCTICASPIENYVPKYFLSERFRPTCEKCDENSENYDEENSLNLDTHANHPVTRRGFKHTPTFTSSNIADPNCSHANQCIIRQPFPPPLPTLTPLVNEYSLYHVKTMAGELDWGSTCWYCMRIDCDNYGCDSCVWIKHFGELHGYPDINPSDYNQHL